MLFVLGTEGPVNYTIVGGLGGTQVLVHKIPNIQIPDNPYMNGIAPLDENVDEIANGLDNFFLKQDLSVLYG